MTLEQFTDYVRRRHKATSDNNWSDVEIYQLITARADEILSVIGLLEATDTSTTSTASTQAYSIPSDCVRIRHVLYAGELIKRLSFKEWETFKAGNSTPTRKPEGWVNFNRQILLVPIPDTTGDTITFYYEKEHPYIDESTDTIDIPSVLHFRLADGVLADMFSKDLNPQMASFYENLWQAKHMPAFQRYAMDMNSNQSEHITDVESVEQSDFGVL